MWDEVLGELKNIDVKPVIFKLDAKPVLKDLLIDEENNIKIIALCLTSTIPIDTSNETIKLFQERYINAIILAKLVNNLFDNCLSYFENPDSENKQR